MSNATQKKVAMKVDVDRTTVSKILNGYQIDQFSNEVVEKVKAAALELGYKSRVKKSACDIGFIFPMPQVQYGIYSDSYRILEAIMGISDALKGTNNWFHIVNYNDKIKFKTLQADAYLVWDTFSEKLIRDFNKNHVEYINLNRVPPDYSGSFVIHDDLMAFRMAAECLTNANHRQVALVCNKYNIETYANTVSKTLGNSGTCHAFIWGDKRCADMLKIFKQNKITGIIASNDVVCSGIIELILNSGAKIPEDYSIVTNNYINTCYLNSLHLTGIKTPWYELAKRGTSILVSRIKKDTNYKSTIREIINPIFIEGNTVLSL